VIVRHGFYAAGLVSVVLTAMLVTTGACSSRASHPPLASSEYYQHSDKRKDEILVLWKQIREWRVEELGLPANPNRTELSAVYRSSVGRLRICPKQPKPKTPKCTDVCTIKDAICDNAEDICRIANELPSDSWARDKCTSAKASCKEARQRCCSCIDKEPQKSSQGGMVPQLPTPF
jgi:hypothetical protein